MGVAIFFSLIFSYFCFFVAAFSPCKREACLQRRQLAYDMESHWKQRTMSWHTPTLQTAISSVA